MDRRCSLILAALSVWALGTDAPALAGEPEPLEVHLGLLLAGVAAEARQGPFHVGGLVWKPLFSNGPAQSLWAAYAFFPQPHTRWKLRIGGVHYDQWGVGCFGVCDPAADYGLFAGVSYRVQAERLWMELTPQYFLPLGGRAYYPSMAMSGLPWVEVGIQVTEDLALSLRWGETPLMVRYRL